MTDTNKIDIFEVLLVVGFADKIPMNLEKALETYGLTEKQAKIYLACLELGSSSVPKIAQKSGISRSTCYEILDILGRHGFVSKFQRKKIINYSAESPRLLIKLAQSKASILEEALPQFDAIYGEARVRPTVRFYEGKEGMKLILEEILEKAKELLAFSSADDLFKTLETEYPEFVKRRIKLKIPAKVVLRQSPKALERARLGPRELREVRFIINPSEYHGTQFIWGRKVAMFAYTPDIVALVIESEALSVMQKTMFEIIWNSLPKNAAGV